MNEPRRPDEPVADAVVDAAWRNASHEEPPAHVDAAILAAARAEARRAAPTRRVTARRAWWSHWQPLAAAAGIAGLAFVLVQNIPRDEPLRSPPSLESKAPETAVAPAGSREQPEAVATEFVAPTREDRQASPAPPRAAAQAVAAPTSPDEWARRIAAAHAAGDLDAASTELREFRRAYPDADRYLPAELQEWASVQPAPDEP
jgi:hypothetical protein